jgi:hypothetical protein
MQLKTRPGCFVNFLLCYAITTPLQAANAMSNQDIKNLSGKPAETSKRSLAIVLAKDAQTIQPIINFYRAVYQCMSNSTSWEILSMQQMRQALPGDDSTFGGIPVLARSDFRKHLPRKRSGKAGKDAIVPGTPVLSLQRMLDNMRTPAAIVVDCASRQSILKGCALYYYDRVSGRVTASVVKTFVAGATDATLWAPTLTRALEDGIANAERQKDVAIIEELVARQEDEEDRSTHGTVAVLARGDRASLSSGWRQNMAGLGLQLGFLNENVGANLEYAQLNWKGSQDPATAARSNYGLNMQFRAHALTSLLWYFEIGGGKEKTEFSTDGTDNSLTSEGIYVHVSPGVGLEISDMFTLNLLVGWRWYFESSTTGTGTLATTDMTSSSIPQVALRATLIL